MFSLAVMCSLVCGGVPDAVTKTIHDTYPKATVKSVEEEHEHGKVVFEAKLDLGTDGATELSIDPSGVLVSEERVISFAQLPAEVKQGLAKSAFAKATVERIEKVTEGGAVSYEITVRDGKRRVEVVFDAKGTMSTSHAATE